MVPARSLRGCHRADRWRQSRITHPRLARPRPAPPPSPACPSCQPRSACPSRGAPPRCAIPDRPPPAPRRSPGAAGVDFIMPTSCSIARRELLHRHEARHVDRQEHLAHPHGLARGSGCRPPRCTWRRRRAPSTESPPSWPGRCPCTRPAASACPCRPPPCRWWARLRESNAQPAGISGCPLRNALKTLPAATVVVAISSSQGPGTDMQIGLVPSRPSLPCHGGTIGDALHITMPICPAARIFCAHQAAAPKWFDSLATTSPIPCCARDPRRRARSRFPPPTGPSPFCPSKCRQLPLSRNHAAVGRADPSRRPATGRHRRAAVESRGNPRRAGWRRPGTRRQPAPCGGDSGALQNGFAEARQWHQP